MTGAIIVNPRENLIEKTAGLISPHGKDYSGNLVVFPGRRPAHFLRKELAQREKGSFVPPVTLSMDGFVDYVIEAVQPVRSVETVDAVAMLYQLHRSAANPLGGKSFLSLDAFFPLGIKLYADLEELYIEGVPPSMIKEIQPFTEEMIPAHAQERLQSLHFFYENFYGKVSRLKMATRSMRYRTAAEKIFESGIEKFEKVIFAGFFALTRSEKDLFKKLLSGGGAIFIFQEGPGLKERLGELGIDGGDSRGSHHEPAVHFYSSPDTHGQVFALGSILREKFGGKDLPDEKTAIVLPSSETLFPLLRHGITFMDKDDFNVSLGYPLHRTPVFGFLNSLMELVSSMEDGRVYIPDYLKFTLHPYTKNIHFKGNSEVTRIIFHTIEEELRKSRTRTFASLPEIESNDRILDAIVEKLGREDEGVTRAEVREHLGMIHRSTIEKFLSFENIGDFSSKCADLLAFIFNNSTARLHPLFYPFSESFIKALSAVSKSMMKDMSFMDRTGYFTFFRKYVMTGHVPFPGTPLKGPQVLGFLETRNIRFDTVFILDANEEVIPNSSKEDTLLPLKAREILKLPTYSDRDELSAYYFDNLIRGAEEAHIFFVESDEKERSRFVENLLWEKQKKSRSTRADDYVKSLQYRIKLGNDAPAPVAKTAGIIAFLKDFTYSATALDTYLKCPLRFYYSYVLGLGKEEEITGDIERADIGRFVHRALSSYFSGKMNRTLKEKDVDVEEMDKLIDALFDREYGRNPAGAAYLLKTQIKEHLGDYLMRYRLPLIRDQKVTIIGVEERVETRLKSFRLAGRLDVVERRNDLICILDYKSGSHSKNLEINFDKLDPDDRNSWDEAIGSLQLPFYLLLYSGRRGIKIEELRGMFILLGRSLINKEIELPLFDEDDNRAGLEGLKTVILGLLEEIVDPAVPFAAAPGMKRSCPGCDFRNICGTQWVAG